MRQSSKVHDELDPTPLQPNGDIVKPHRLALCGWPRAVWQDVQAHPFRTLSCSLCITLLILTMTGFGLLFSRILPLVCTQLSISAIEMPDLCVFQTPLRLVLNLASVAPATVLFTDPAFSLLKADGTTLIALDVLGSCVQRRLDEQCHILVTGTIARRREGAWGCFASADGDLSRTACIGSDGSPATCYDAPMLEMPRVELENWLVAGQQLGAGQASRPARGATADAVWAGGVRNATLPFAREI